MNRILYSSDQRTVPALGLALAILFGPTWQVRAADVRPKPLPVRILQKLQRGIASWHVGSGDRTASGVRWQSEDLMAAHRTLPLGSRVRVTNVKNGRSTVVRITDRGPYSRGRVIDLSRAAARELDLLGSGVGQVQIEILPTVEASEAEAKPQA